ncbi:Fic family protein [Edwardsiella anguillarum]|uniref:Fic family protein n=1 Tax=Edwardsiella anguillarum TaxID=1821960 RepID=UPI0024B785E9|nr:Fic family protein [Edwardsiella anguillarum]WHQ14765.1 Fic family protein [Edwardsiella anguillarum]
MTSNSHKPIEYIDESGSDSSQSTSIIDIANNIDVVDISFVVDSNPIYIESIMKTHTQRSRRSESSDIVGDLSLQIKKILLDLDMSKEGSSESEVRAGFNIIFIKAEEAREVQSVPPGKERDIRQLIKTIELISAFIDEIKGKENIETTLEISIELFKKLLALGDSQTDELSRSILERYKECFFIKKHQETEVKLTTESPVERSDDVILTDAIMKLGAECLERVEKLYQPILNPSSYINNYIKDGIDSFEKTKGFKTYLTPISNIQVNYFPDVSPNPNLQGHKSPVAISLYFSLTEIITGQYLYKSKELRDPLGRKYKIISMDHQELISEFAKKNLQSIMEQDFNTYHGQAINAENMKSFYQDMINIRCLRFLDRKHQPAVYVQAVKKFLRGELQAKEVSFHGAIVNGVFLIPVGASAGIMFCVDEEKYFYIGQTKHVYWEDKEYTEMLPSFPQTSEFKKWIFSKIPTYNYIDLERNSLAFKYVTDTYIAYGPFQYVNRIMVRPFTFSATNSRENLADRLYNALMNRTKSDIDTLVFSYPEQITETTLEVAKAILLIGAISLSIAAIPGTGAVLARLSIFMTALALDAIYVGISVAQYHTTDRPDQAETFRNEAIIAGVLGGVGAIAGGVPLISQGIKSAYSVKNINRAIMLYRQAKAVSRRVIPSVLSELNWNRLVDQKKIKLLIDTTLENAQGKSLVKLTSRETVQRSVRNNLLLDFEGLPKANIAWGGFELEQAHVQRRINSDLARLNGANNHIEQLLLNPPTVSRQIISGISGRTEEAAAEWIVSKSTSIKTVEQSQELTNRIKEILIRHRDADLLNINTIDAIHDEVYKPAAGHLVRTYRSSSDPIFMGSDVARVGFEKSLISIEAKNVVAPVDLGDVLYAAIVRYHPFGDGNGRTARTIYALDKLKKDTDSFIALSQEGEDILNPPGPLS